jgi:hypothetical protein
MQYEKIEKYAFRRFCSADLADQRAYRWGNFGTKDRIFTNGEQDGEGRVPVVVFYSWYGTMLCGWGGWGVEPCGNPECKHVVDLAHGLQACNQVAQCTSVMQRSSLAFPIHEPTAEG